ncbi:bifunctional diguanylate cyclase/phosphodiesterase [Aliidiomarina halalkaliphila]|uniref:Bifunctional diguanylate cyclase/phosphodiesterase n=1 Tax=Aliidiomarina halalkaliphila TaxID=2593535 RepID=A0A552WZQ2_9GAMM|nr:EAL domain-containing protein [Aliidiomarina halalkaliphila]TRW48292.1 bifunctional diguanylate cyclase/phosphodiesterase [Aliidiomarina halalkaliphila]
MAGYDTRTSASAAYYVAALTGAAMGVIGLLFASLAAPHTLLEIISARTSFGALIVSFGFILVAQGKRSLQIIPGVICIVLSLLQLWNRLFISDLELTWSFSLMLLHGINVHFFFLGMAFLFPPNSGFGRNLWRFTLYLSLTLAIALLIYAWMPDTENLNLPLPMSFIGVAFLLALTSVMLYSQLKYRFSRFEIDWPILLPAVLVSALGIFIWFSLSAMNVRDIDNRAEILLEQTIVNVDKRLGEHHNALRRLVLHWTHLAEQNGSILPDSMAFLEDHPLIVSIAMYDEHGELEFEALSPHASNQLWTMTADLRDPPKEWLEAAMGREDVLISRETTALGIPLLYVTVPMQPEQNALTQHRIPDVPKQVVMTLDVQSIVDVPQNRFLDFFTVYVEVSTQLVISANRTDFHYYTIEDFERRYPLVYSREAEVLQGYTRTFYVTLGSTEVIWQSARVNQFVFILSSLFALLLVTVADANKQLKEERDKLDILATYDGVTGLVRRDVLERRLSELLLRKNARVYVMFIDLDGFKPINDTFGIALGNQLLADVGRRIMRVTRDTAIVSRFSGDEFILVTQDYSSDELKALTTRLLSEVRQPFMLDGVSVHLTASIGIAGAESMQGSAETMIQNADVAMTGAKRLGGDTYLFFTPIMTEAYNREVELRARIQEAILNDEFEMYYQPIVAAHTGEIVGVEALARWPQPDGSMVSPGEFIPVAEQTGQIHEISDLVMKKAFADLKTIEAKVDWFVSINFSARLFHRGNIVKRVDYLLNEADVAGKRVHVEVTESVFADDQHNIPEKLKALQQRGLKISIDDFGTGYSSLSLLYKLPLDVIKIDRTFITDLQPDSAAYQVASTVIDLAHRLNKQVIVEGIETEAQVAFCREKNCDSIQGFYFYRPMPFSELLVLVAKNEKTS